MAVSKAMKNSSFVGGTNRHIPVLLPSMLKALKPVDGGVYVDGTFGAGGYARAILMAGDTRVIGIDRDPDAIRDARAMLREFGSRLDVAHGHFSKMSEFIAAKNLGGVDGVVLDIGVSSMQLDTAERGFSFRADGPLDMRMSKSGPTAADLVNGLAEEEIANLLWLFGEERKSRHIARAIVDQRREKLFSTTLELADLIAKIVKVSPREKKHPATRSFQALRIYLNDELGELLGGLNDATSCLKPGGRIVVVSFHSLEDRIVKSYIKAAAARVPNQSRYLPDVHKEVCPSLRIINSKPVKASDEEIKDNIRARSAILRFAIRTEHPSLVFDETSLGLKSFQL